MFSPSEAMILLSKLNSSHLSINASQKIRKKGLGKKGLLFLNTMTKGGIKGEQSFNRSV